MAKVFKKFRLSSMNVSKKWPKILKARSEMRALRILVLSNPKLLQNGILADLCSIY